MSDYCKSCLGAGRSGLDAMATRVVNGVKFCEPCYDRIREGLPEKAEEKTEMAKDVDWKKAKEDKENGMKTKDICEKYDTSAANFYYHMKQLGGVKGVHFKSEGENKRKLAPLDFKSSPERDEAEDESNEDSDLDNSLDLNFSKGDVRQIISALRGKASAYEAAARRCNALADKIQEASGKEFSE